MSKDPRYLCAEKAARCLRRKAWIIVRLAIMLVTAGTEMRCLQAGIAWTPAGQPPGLQLNLPSDPTLTWIAGADNLLPNGDFEQGLTNGWSVETVRGGGFTANYAGAPGLGNVPVLEGAISACLSGQEPDGVGELAVAGGGPAGRGQFRGFELAGVGG